MRTWIRNIFSALEFPAPSTNGTIILLSLVNLSFVKYVQKNFSVFSSTSFHLVPSPVWPTDGSGRALMFFPPVSALTCTPLGLEKSFGFPWVQEPWGEKREKAAKLPMWGQPGLGPSFSPQFSWREGQSLAGLGTVCFGCWPSWAVHLTIWPLFLGLQTWFKGRLPKGRKTNY